MRDIIRLVLSGGFRPVLAGAVFGLIGAVYLSHITRELPAFGGSSLPVTAAAALLIIVALAASSLPARRAAKVDPLTALRAK